ncbi:MAG: RIP metalloprotease RseP [Candidatus Aminicenantales bacterium]|jgi:regulator of sigma E protease
MATIFGTLLAFVIVFGILVFVHEFGHFFMAKLVGIRVEVFSFGYGKRLFGFKKGETDYRVSLIPMGGYVKLLGEGMFEPSRAIDPDDMMAKPRWQRLLVMAMGSIMNIILAVVLVAVINGVGVPRPIYQDEKPVIGWIDKDSPAANAGLRIGDEVVRINERPVKTWSDVEIAVGSRPDKKIRLDILRDGQTASVELQTESVSRYSFGYAGFRARALTQVQMVTANSPAEQAGLKPGDVIQAVDGQPVYFYQFIQVLERSAGKELQFSVERGGRTLTIPVTPRRQGNVGKIGIAQIPQSVLKKYGFLEAISQSVRENLKNTFLVVQFLKDLFTGEASTKQLGGPLKIASFSYDALRMGWLAMITWIAAISLQLGILNLIPIPVFDGGQIFVLLIESVFRRDLSPKARTIWMQIGFVIFVALIAFVILNDIVNQLPHGWGSLLPF